MNKIALLSSVAVIGLLSAGPGYAQQAQKTAKSTPGDTATLAEIVVTAQHRKENLQDVPIAISVVSGAALDKTGFKQVTDLQYLVPSLQYDPNNGGAFQIRGVGSESYDYSAEQSVSMVVDDVVIDAQRDPGITGLNDVDRFEVLRGPQGTLFGKNATSGVISITTNNPVLNEWSGDAGATYGERNDHKLNLTLNVPLNQSMAFRITGFAEGQDGYGKYTVAKKPMGSFREAGARAKLMYKPTDQLRVLFEADYASHVDNQAETLASAVPSIATASTVLGAPPGPNNFNTATPNPWTTENSSWGASLNISYHLGDQTLTSITAYRGTATSLTNNVDEAPTSLFLPVNQGGIRTNKFSQELRLASPTGQLFEYVVGLYYNRLALFSTSLQWGTLGQPAFPGVLLSTTGNAGTTNNEDEYNTVNESKALYGQTKVNFSDSFHVIVGGRYTMDNNSQSLTFIKAPTAPYFLVIPIFAQLPPSQGTASTSNLSYRIAPEYKIAPHVLAYFTYSTGYKGPGVAFISNKFDPYKAETVKSYEVGIKSELMDRRLRLNLDAFDEKFTNFQAQTLVQPPVGLPFFAIGNAGGLRSRGFEVDANLLIVQDLSVSEGLSYTLAKFTDYVDGPTVYTRDRLTNAPQWTTNTTISYDPLIGDGYRLHASASYAWRSNVFTVIGQPYSVVRGFGLLNARIGVESGSGKAWQLGVYARNLLDQHFQALFTSTPGLGILQETSPEAFRTVGVFANYKF